MEGPSIFELSETILNMLRSPSKHTVSSSTSKLPAPHNGQSEQEQKQHNELQSVVVKPSFIQEHFVKVYAESENCNDCHLAGQLSFDFIDPEVLQSALNQLIIRETALRTRFETISSKIQAVVVAPHQAPCKISFFDYTTKYDEEEGFNIICNATSKDAKRPFDMTKAPLLRVHLYKYSGGWIVYTVVHHAVLDGVAMLMLWRLLFTTYHSIVEARKNGTDTPRALSAASYKEYVDMEEKYLSSDKYESDAAFWKQYLSALDPLQFPEGVPISPGNHQFTANKFHFVIPSNLVRRLIFKDYLNTFLLFL